MRQENEREDQGEGVQDSGKTRPALMNGAETLAVEEHRKIN